jgi:hypothetical protein
MTKKGESSIAETSKAQCSTPSRVDTLQHRALAALNNHTTTSEWGWIKMIHGNRANPVNHQSSGSHATRKQIALSLF